MNRLVNILRGLEPSSWAIRRQWRNRFGEKINLRNPQTFNEKIQWLKIHYRNPIAERCADKVGVREIVADRIGPQYLNEVYLVTPDPKQIPWDDLPDSFVVKTNHASNQNIIVQDKRTLNRAAAEARLRAWLKFNHGRVYNEFVYSRIPPKVLVERYLANRDGSSLDDYKVFCFDGEPHMIQVDYDRFTNHRRDLYDLEWHLLPFRIAHDNIPGGVPKPDCLPELLRLAKALAQGFPHVRVDFYIVNGTPVFGEMTFFHGSGFEFFSDRQAELDLGALLVLPGTPPADPQNKQKR